jgi:hypothetical protein
VGRFIRRRAIAVEHCEDFRIDRGVALEALQEIGSGEELSKKLVGRQWAKGMEPGHQQPKPRGIDLRRVSTRLRLRTVGQDEAQGRTAEGLVKNPILRHRLRR